MQNPRRLPGFTEEERSSIMKKLRLVSTIGVLVVLLLVAATSAYGGQERVDVCHITGTYDFGDGRGEVPIGHVITIADPAYDSHIAHGDPPAHVEVALPDGTVVCTAELETPETMTVFITSVAYNGDLGGIGGADAKCQAAADAEGAIVPEGTYKAWLSTHLLYGDYSPATSEEFAKWDGPYVGTDGSGIADGWTDLTDGTLQNPIIADEYGTTRSGVKVWTNTQADGTAGYSDCRDVSGGWTSTGDSSEGGVGNSEFSDWQWTDSSEPGFCWYADAHLYCFQQPEPPETRTVFMTSGLYNGSSLGGLAGADAVCQDEADAAGLPGTYKAWLSAAGEGNSAAERLTHSEVPYVRVDGTQVADSWDDLTDGSLDAPIGPFPAGPEIWTGTASDGSFVSGSSDCGAWTNTTGAGAVYGLCNHVTSGWTQSEYTYDCDISLWLYCFEQ
jgi:hypothetical protein